MQKQLSSVFGQRRLSYRHKIGHLINTVYRRMNENVVTGRKVTVTNVKWLKKIWWGLVRRLALRVERALMKSLVSSSKVTYQKCRSVYVHWIFQDSVVTVQRKGILDVGPYDWCKNTEKKISYLIEWILIIIPNECIYTYFFTHKRWYKPLSVRAFSTSDYLRWLRHQQRPSHDDVFKSKSNVRSTIVLAQILNRPQRLSQRLG